MTTEAPVFDSTLASLFEAELETTLVELAQGIVCIEEGEGDPAQIDRVMRAAHSIKGAARIVGVEAAVQLAHALEDFFSWAQNGPVPKEAIDGALRGVDALTSLREACSGDLAGWVTRDGDAAIAVAASIASLARGRPAAPIESPESPPDPPPPAITRAVQPPATKREASAVPAEPRRESGDRVLRVNAQSVDRLMGLTGESLVEARRMPAFVARLNQHKARLSALSDRLAEVEGLAGDAVNPALAGALHSARAHLHEDRRQLGDEIEGVENLARRIEDLNGRVHREALKSRMRPFRDGVVGLPRMVRDVARQLGKQARLEIVGDATLVDRDVLERLESCLSHLLRNAIDHGLEAPAERTALGKESRGKVAIEARHHAGMLAITVSDDGRGVDLEAARARVIERGLASEALAAMLSPSEVMDFLFLPGFSTARSVTEISGRGVGLDAVRNAVEAAGGTVRVESERGRHTTFQLRLPVTRSVIRALLVEIGGARFAFPLIRIGEILRVPRIEVTAQEGRELVMHRGQSLALVQGAPLVGFEAIEPAGDELFVVVISERATSIGIVVDRLLGEQDLAVHPLDARLGRVQGVSAAAILADGSPVLIADVDDLFRSLDRLLGQGRLTPGAAVVKDTERRARRVLVVEDSITVREAERQLLANAGYEVETAVDGVDGWNVLRTHDFDLVVTDIDMPGMNGIDLVRSIRGDERLRSLPVIIVSYKDRQEDKLRGLDAGATCYLTKTSFHDRTFIDAVEDLIGRDAA